LSKILGFYKNVCFWTASELEKNIISETFKNICVNLVPNFVSTETNFRFIQKHPGQLKLITVTRISPKKNLLFAAKMLNQKYKGEITWDIYGPIDDKAYHQKLIETIEQTHINAKYRGELEPYKIRDKISEYHFYFLPTLGENFGHSIFDAFASSRPVIISNTTPWTNLKSRNLGWDCPLDPNCFVNAIQNAIDTDQKTFDLMCKSAAELARQIIENQQKQIQNIIQQFFKTLNS
jgi:glycosyltransferase involved in cell wall biosynthesis